MRSDFSLNIDSCLLALSVNRVKLGRAYLPHMGDFVEPPPKPNSKTLVFCFFFNSGSPITTSSIANPTNIANANSETPTPADRVVPIHGWRTKKDQEGDKRTKKRTKGEGRWVVLVALVVSLGFHRVRCLGGGSTKSTMRGK